MVSHGVYGASLTSWYRTVSHRIAIKLSRYPLYPDVSHCIPSTSHDIHRLLTLSHGTAWKFMIFHRPVISLALYMCTCISYSSPLFSTLRGKKKTTRLLGNQFACRIAQWLFYNIFEENQRTRSNTHEDEWNRRQENSRTPKNNDRRIATAVYAATRTQRHNPNESEAEITWTNIFRPP